MPHVVDPTQGNYFRWPVRRKLRRTHTDDGVQVTWLGSIMRRFTHIAAPRHFEPSCATSDQLDINTEVGEAAIIVVRHVGSNAPIEAEHIRAAGGFLWNSEVVLLRAGWDRIKSIGTPKF